MKLRRSVMLMFRPFTGCKNLEPPRSINIWPLSSPFYFYTLLHSIDVFVAAPGEIYDHDRIWLHLARDFDRIGHSIRGFECGDNTFQLRKSLKGLERFVI